MSAKKLNAPKDDPDDCTFCLNKCEAGIGAGFVTGLGQAIAGDIGGAILSFGGTIIGGNICENDCTKEGGPCCQVQCATGGPCCASGQFCCSGGSGIDCCDNGGTCTQDSNGLYNWCCGAGDDPVGCSAFGGTTLTLVCRRPGQACCGPWNACDVGQYCADAEYGICCPHGAILLRGELLRWRVHNLQSWHRPDSGLLSEAACLVRGYGCGPNLLCTKQLPEVPYRQTNLLRVSTMRRRSLLRISCDLSGRPLRHRPAMRQHVLRVRSLLQWRLLRF